MYVHCVLSGVIFYFFSLIGGDFAIPTVVGIGVMRQETITLTIYVPVFTSSLTVTDTNLDW